jgi:threonine dehydratase
MKCQSIIHALQVTFPVCSRFVDDWILVDEQQISDAVFFMIDKHHKVSKKNAG